MATRALVAVNAVVLLPARVTTKEGNLFVLYVVSTTVSSAVPAHVAVVLHDLTDATRVTPPTAA
jgi:hypothetical protein